MIRNRDAADLDACAAVLAEVHRHNGYPHHWPADPARWLTPDGLTAAWVAEESGVIVGHAALCGPEISRLYVHPAARGNGVGGSLLRTAHDTALAHGRAPVLEVKATDHTAVALYERHGWTRTATEEQEWQPGERVVIHRYRAGRGD
ncbi:GNAT family N-acetyltransferase [Streptomyces sp. NBC_01525]|uniref:GNAT family N-acetyltransferase n=1 Tax=Streptomyces sp. NBC_01525 TaxID=2903893 RepID=UPI0038703834